jgi:putative membrane protein
MHGHLDAGTVLRWWTIDPLVIGAFLLTTILYVRGARSLGGSNARLKWWEKLSFATGWAAVLLALVSPLDRLSDILFSAHMTQHELLILVAAPLLVLGRPLVAFMHAFTPASRQALQHAMRDGSSGSVWRALTRPLAAVVLHGAVVWLWHIPRLYEWALRNELVHTLQHLMFFVTAALFWWALMHGRYGRIGYGMSVVFVFVTAMHTGLLGVLLTFARVTWYPLYDARAVAWRVSALEDQQLAGLIMWIPSGVLFMLLALALFGAWLGETERRASVVAPERRRPRETVMPNMRVTPDDAGVSLYVETEDASGAGLSHRARGTP